MNHRSRQQLLAHVRRTATQHNPMFAPRSQGASGRSREAVLAARLSWVARVRALLDTPYGSRPTTD